MQRTPSCNLHPRKFCHLSYWEAFQHLRKRLFNYRLAAEDLLLEDFRGFQVSIGHSPYLFTADVDLARSVLALPDPVTRKSYDYDLIGCTTGNGLLTTNGLEWKAMRARHQPFFSNQSMRTYLPQMIKSARSLINDRADGQPFDLRQWLTHVVITLQAQSFMGTSRPEVTLEKSVRFALRQHARYAGLALLLPEPFSSFFRSRLRVGKETLATSVGLFAPFGTATLAEHSSLCGAGEEELLTYFIAGSEPTATILGVIIHLLHKQTGIYESLVSEIDTLASSDLSFELLSSLPYLDSVVKEAMRLNPPIWLLGRRFLADFAIDDYSFSAGTTLYIHLGAIHRQEKHYPDPHSFRPDRWTEAGTTTKSLFPFGHGQRKCIGMPYSETLIKLILVQLIRLTDFSISTSHSQNLSLKTGVALTINKPFPIRLTLRNIA